MVEFSSGEPPADRPGLPQGGGADGPPSEQAPLPEAEVVRPLSQHDVIGDGNPENL